MIRELGKNTYAIIIAVENYQFGLKKVEYARNDAQAFQQWLINNLEIPTENIKLWLDVDVTKSALTEELRYEISRLNTNDQFIFYYAGHGFFDGGHNKITTWDTHPYNLKETSVSLNQIIMDPLRNSECNKSLIFIDACAGRIDEQLTRSRDIITDMHPMEFSDFVRASNYRAMFLSCSRGEKSYGSPTYEHGIWTYFLLKALTGKAPEAIEYGRFITSASLQNYLSKVVPDYIKTSNEIRGPQKPWAEISSASTFVICEVPEPTQSDTTIDFIFIPERLIIGNDIDLIFAPLRELKNDGRKFPMYDSEGLEEIDVEAYCIRISRLKSGIESILDEIIDFQVEYEWEDEVIFENEDDKFTITAFLNRDNENGGVTISLCLSLKISGLHPLGDIIFDACFDTAKDELEISTDNSAFNVDENEIYSIFLESWNGIRDFFLREKKLEVDLLDEIESGEVF